MKSTELRSLLADWVTSLSPIKNLDIPHRERGLLIPKSSVMIAPILLMSNKKEPVEVGYPIQIIWRFPGSLKYNQLPLGLIEAVLMLITHQGLPCNPDVSLSIGETDIEVAKVDDGVDWLVSLKFIVVASFDWEIEDDFLGIIPNRDSFEVTIDEIIFNYEVSEDG